MFKLLLVLVLAFFVTNAAHFGETDCGSQGKILDIHFSSCTSQPCKLRRGSSYDVEVQFVPSQLSTTLTFSVVAALFGPVHTTITEGNACSELVGAGCPYSAKNKIQYQKSVMVSRFFPDIRTTVTFKLQDDKGTTQICINTDVEIE